MSSCECGSTSFLRVSGKTSDTCTVIVGDYTHNGYVPGDIGIGGGDYLQLRICTQCGKVHGFKPQSEKDLARAIRSYSDPNFEDEE